MNQEKKSVTFIDVVLATTISSIMIGFLIQQLII